MCAFAFACMNFSVPPGVCTLIEAALLLSTILFTALTHFIGPAGETEALEGD